MSGRHARLKKEWMLRGWSDLPRALVNWRTGNQRKLTKVGFFVAESCDGQTDFESLVFGPQDHATLDLLIAQGIAENCREGDGIEPWQRYRKADNPKLSGIHWCVTGLCNLNCRHCYMQAPAGRYGQLPFDALFGFVEQFERANVTDVSLSGGEPFIRNDLLQIIALLAHKKIRLYQIFSNGLRITDRHLEEIRNIGFRPVFRISFDGVGAHEQMRGTAGIQQGVVNAIRRLRTAGFPVVVSTSIDTLNIGSLSDTYELLKTLDIEAWGIAPPQETGNWRGTTTAGSLDQQAAACAPLLKRWFKDGQPFSIAIRGLYHGDRAPKPGTPPSPRPLRAAPEYSPDDYDCGACREKLNLLPDGTLLPCPGYADSPVQNQMPNLLRDDLSKVWKRSILRRLANMKKKDLLAANPECAACTLFKICGLGCRAWALSATGNLMAKDPVVCELCKKDYRKHFLEIAALEPVATL